MTDLVDRIIHSLREHHDQLTALVAALGPDELRAPSAASQWRICDVLSHLGSGAEITVKPLLAAAEGAPAAEADNEAIWARWNAASPEEQAAWYVVHDAYLIETAEGFSAEQRATAMVDMGFLPQPVPLVVAAGMRLNEVALHVWDIRAGLDAEATVDAEATDILLELFAGPLSFLIGFVAKPDQMSAPAAIDIAGRGLSIEDTVALLDEAPMAPTATFAGPREAALRLLSGRLTPAFTPEGVTVTGNVTIDDLRAVFPGY